jgi:hypothetical protein
MFCQEIFFSHGINHKVNEEDQTFYLDHRVSKSLGSYQVNIYVEAPILIPPNWQLEFYVHIDASLLAVVAMFAQNSIGKYDQLIVYASRLLNKVEHNYITTSKEVLTIVYALHKFIHFFVGKHIYFLCTPRGSCIFGQQTACV